MSLSNLFPALALGAAIFASTSCTTRPGVVQANASRPVPVETVAALSTNWQTGSDAVGTVRARTSAVLSSKVMGYVREVRVHAGDTVRAGQVVAVLDSRDLEVSYRQAQAARDEVHDAQAEADNSISSANANLELAQATFRRMQDLFQKRSISNQEYDESSARLKTAQAGYDMALSRKTQLASRTRQSEEGVQAAEVMRSYAELHAPFAGIVTERHAEPGILATPGLPLFAVEQAGGYRLEVSADESLAPHVRVGQQVRIHLESLERDLDSRVSEIVPAIDPGSRGFIVKIDLPAMKDLHSGLYGKARFITGSRTAVTIPSALVRRNGQIESVMVAVEGSARMRLITAGESQGGQTEVLTGLSSGEKVIRNTDVHDGSPVEVR